MDASWLKYLPGFVRNKLDGRHGLQKAFSNAGWLFADRSVRMGVGLVVGVWVGRYLGPLQFGEFNYAVAFAALFGPIATLGLDTIVIRELAKRPERKNELLGSAFILKLCGGVAAFSGAVACTWSMKRGDSLTIWLVGLAAGGFLFQPLNVIDFYFQSNVRSKYSVFASNGAFIIMTLVRVVLLITSAPLIYFACAALGEIMFTSAFYLVAYRANDNDIRSWRCNRATAFDLLSNSWPLIFASVALMVQARIDQVMLGDMVGTREVGQYAAAMRLIEVFGFVPTIIVSTISPHVARAKAVSEAVYHRRLLEAYRTMTITFLLVAVPIFFLGERMVLLLYGSEYRGAAVLLSFFAIRLFFANFGVAKTLFLTNESLFVYSLITAIIGAIVNIVGNYFLIPRFHSVGAILASIVSFSTTTFVMDIFYARTRVNLKLMILGMLKPFTFRSQEEY
jgi:O-antigen/teichoic acid export membrane protein